MGWEQQVHLVRCCLLGVTNCMCHASVQVLGTPGFRGPEVVEAGWSVASDVYAFGIIIWQMLTGLKPIEYDPEWHMHMPNPLLLVFSNEVPLEIQQIAVDCCRDDPAARPTMKEVITCLPYCFRCC